MYLCANKGELVFVVQDTHDQIFGGYFSQSMEIKPDFYGTGETFLFQLKVASHQARKKDCCCTNRQQLTVFTVIAPAKASGSGLRTTTDSSSTNR
jgi:TLD